VTRTAPAPPRLLDERPQVHVRADEVRAQARSAGRFTIASGRSRASLRSWLCSRPPGARKIVRSSRLGPEAMEEAPGPCSRSRAVPCCPHRSTADRLRPVGGRDLAQTSGGEIERLVPRDALEAASALATARPGWRMRSAVDPLEIAIHLAHRKPRVNVTVIATERHGAAVGDVHRHDAGIGAVVRTDGLDSAHLRALLSRPPRSQDGSVSADPYRRHATSTTFACVTCTCSHACTPALGLDRDGTVIELRPTRHTLGEEDSRRRRGRTRSWNSTSRSPS